MMMDYLTFIVIASCAEKCMLIAIRIQADEACLFFIYTCWES